MHLKTSPVSAVAGLILAVSGPLPQASAVEKSLAALLCEPSAVEPLPPARLKPPTDVAPPFGPPMDPTSGRDWMPKGAKRLDLADDEEGGASVRRAIREALEKGP